MENIGTGLSMLCLEPSKSGLYSPPAPIMTVQSPDTDGPMGNSKGGAGNVNAVWADAESGKAAMAPNAASNGAEAARRTVLTAEERKKAWTTWFMDAPDLPLAFSGGSARVVWSD